MVLTYAGKYVKMIMSPTILVGFLFAVHLIIAD